MPRVVPTVRDWEGAAVEVIEMTIPMEYPGGEISKNRLWKGGNRRFGMNPVALTWRRTLADSVQWSLLAAQVRTVLSVEGTIGGTFQDRGHAPDLHNLVELCADAVEEATIDDRDHTWRTLPAEYDAAGVPEVRVGLRLGVIRRGE